MTVNVGSVFFLSRRGHEQGLEAQYRWALQNGEADMYGLFKPSCSVWTATGWRLFYFKFPQGAKQDGDS